MSRRQVIDLKYKKEPKQARSKATVEAIIQASAQVLVEDGYGRLSTNLIAERSGVSVGSIYEYFPGKEAIVAAVATQVVERSLARIQEALNQSETLDFEIAMRNWIRNLYAITQDEHKLIKVLLFQVPYILKVPAVAGIGAELIRIALIGASKTREYHYINPSPESLYLISTMTGSTLLQLAMFPPKGMKVERVLDELTRKVIQWFYELQRPS